MANPTLTDFRVASTDGLIPADSTLERRITYKGTIKNNSTKTIRAVEAYTTRTNSPSISPSLRVFDYGTEDVTIKSGKTASFEFTAPLHSDTRTYMQTHRAVDVTDQYINGLYCWYSDDSYYELFNETSPMLEDVAVIEPNGYIIVIDTRCIPAVPEFRVVRAGLDPDSHTWVPDDEGEGAIINIRTDWGNDRWAANSKCYLRSYIADELLTEAELVSSGGLTPADFMNGIQLSYAELIGLPESQWSGAAASPFNNGSDIRFELTWGDYDTGLARLIESTTQTWTVSRAFANLHLSGNPAGGVAIGKFCDAEKAPAFECAFPAYMLGGIVGVTTYSTDEVDTGGKWVDGKPIYAKTEVKTGSFASNSTQHLLADNNVDTVIALYGFAARSPRSSYGAKFPLGSYYSTSIWTSAYFDSKLDYLVISNHGYASDEIRATILYTKTTD